MTKKQFLICLFSLICFVQNIHSQDTYSPYSMLGLGEIESKDYGRTSGMSNIGIGIRDGDYLNPLNPAGISGLDSLKLIFDISVAGKQSYFSGKGKKNNTFNGNFKKIALGTRLHPKWSLAVGLQPFSSVGYQIYSEEPIEGSTATKAVYLKGSGGLYELYLSNGIKISDNFSFGINTKYISGTIKQTEDHSELLFDNESRVSQFHNTFGVQYHKNGFTLGATYGYKQNISLSNATKIYDGEYNIIEEEKGRSTNQFIPETMGLGFTHNHKKILWGMDFQYQKWDGIESGVSNINIIDSYKINAGLGYTPNDKYVFSKKTQIQVGTSFSKSYIQVGRENAYNYSVSVGGSLPFDDTLINIALEYGNTLSAPTNYIRESYFMLTLNCQYIEKLFKRKKIK